MQTSNTAEMVTISRVEYEQLQQEKVRLEAKNAKLEEQHARLEAKFAAREQEQAQVITSLTLQNEWLLERCIFTFYRSAQRRRRGCSIPPERMLNLSGRGA